MNHRETLAWVMKHLPTLASKALDKFVERNRHYNGAHWDDCLDVLIDSDSHLDITEPMSVATYMGTDDIILDGYDPLLVDAVAITIFYADKAFANKYTAAMRAVAVKATIDGAS